MATSYEAETVLLDSERDSASLQVIGLEVPYWGEDPWPPPALGLAEYSWLTSVRRPAGPCRSPSSGFIT